METVGTIPYVGLAALALSHARVLRNISRRRRMGLGVYRILVRQAEVYVEHIQHVTQQARTNLHVGVMLITLQMLLFHMVSVIFVMVSVAIHHIAALPRCP